MLARSAALDDEQRNIRPAPTQLVGDPCEGVDPLFETRVNERDKPRIGRVAHTRSQLSV